ncbi:MAG TPA: sulfate/thiosulfate ABC transporter permease CysW, partial [Verrucomicrobiae bacterium]|nr:sulfate/thiosulfate ABC transporter permease CysW [Verrucomicrobiae bacterium]
MGGHVKPSAKIGRTKSRRGTEEPWLVKWGLILLALLFAGVFLLLPLINVFAQAFSKGWDEYRKALIEPDTLAAIKLTLLVAVITVPLNVFFGVAAAWAIAKFNFRGKSFLL